ncbi:MAG: type II secretion system protein GspC [Steroidobacteraceae bacterium]
MNAASWLATVPAADRWRALILRDGPRIATWILAVALAVQAALILTDLGGAGRAPRAQPVVSRAPHVTDVAAITNAHLFGAAPAPKSDDANAPQTSMPLVLTGIIAGNDPKNGLAILGASAQTAKVYAVGDSVPGGATLHSVYIERVVIERNGQLESLALPRQEGNPVRAPSSSALDNPNAAVVERMRKTFTEQPGLIADLLRPQAVRDGDKVRGFRVYPGRNRAAFTSLGLQPGDEVIAINGTPLDDLERGQEILRTLGSSSEARVTVIRNNQQQDLTLNIAQVAQEAESVAGPGAQAPGPAGGMGPPGAAMRGGMPIEAAPADPTQVPAVPPPDTTPENRDNQ